MKRYVIGDIHGTRKALIQVLQRCNFDYENDLLITLGDIVDGYPDTYLVVEELLKIKNRIDILGNHDEWFQDFINFGIHEDSWSQGGLYTAKSYAKHLNIDLKIHTKSIHRYRQPNKFKYILNLIPDDIPDSHKSFFRSQHRYYKDEDNNIFVHGGFNRHLSINNTPTDYLIWDRKLWDQALSANSGKQSMKFAEEVKNVFIGHTTTLVWNTDLPMKADKVWNLDTGAGSTGKLTIMNVDTHEYFQSDLVTDLYPEHGKKHFS